MKSFVVFFKVFLIALLVFGTFSCYEKGPTLNYGILKSVSLELPELDHNFSNLMKTFPEDRNVLFFKSRYKNRIYLFDLEKQVLLKTLNFDAEGPEAVPKVNGISRVKDQYILSFNQGTILIFLDKSFNEIERLDYSVDTSEIHPIPVYLWSYTKKEVVLIKDNQFLIPRLPSSQLGNSSLQNSLLLSEPLGFVFNLSDHSVSPLSIFLPDNYFDLGNFPTDYSMTLVDKDLVYSFRYSNEIIKFNSKGHIINKGVIESKFIKNMVAPDNLANPVDYYLSESSYQNVFYDEQRDLIYRIANFPMLKEEIEFEDFDDIYYKKRFSIMVYDNKLNLLGEFIIGDGSNYVSSNMFIGPGGLWISKSNPYNPDYKEGKLEFDVFSFVYQ